MTYGYEIEPLADTATRLGGNLARPLLDMVHEYAQALPIEAGQVISTGPRTARIYWVSGSSLVTLETEEIEHNSEEGRFSTGGKGTVIPLDSARTHIEISGQTEPLAGPEDWRWHRTVKLSFGDESVITLPDPLTLPLDNQNKRDQANGLIDAVLRAVSRGQTG